MLNTPRAESEEHKVHIKGETPSRTWQTLWDFEDYLPQSWKQMPSEAIDNSYNGGAPLMIEDFAKCIIDDSRPPIDVIDAVNMTAPGLMSEVSRENGGAPVEVPSFD